MNVQTRLLLTGTAAMVLLLGSPATPVTASAPPDPAAIAAVVESGLGPARLPGVAVALVEDGRVLHTAGYGHDANGEPVTGRTPMRIASLSKSFTALAVMQLAEAGELGLDDPVVRHLPEFAMADPRADRITVRQLLDHSSGMSDTAYPEAALAQPGSLRQAVADLRDAGLAADPGRRHDYHNPNYWVAARLVEVVSGRPFAEHLAQRVFTPLRMASTVTVDNWQDPVPGLVDGHNRFLGLTRPRAEPDRFVAGSAGIATTADDLARWLALHTRDTESTVLSREGLRELRRPSAPDGHYALGWDNPDPVDGPRQITHNGSSFTSTATMVLLPDSGYGIALMSNSRMPLEADVEGIMDGLIALTRGTPATGAPAPLALIADLTVLAAAVPIATAVGLKARRARAWARRRSTAAPWTTALRLLPYLLPLPVFAALPRILELVTGGRGVTFLLLSHIWPTFLAAVGVIAASGVLLLTARVRALLRLRPVRVPRPESADPPGTDG
ncbi:serine hydrolase domain-containing protein [Nocardiopsis tropica]|uniref:Serine hydrolase domain-containing protein n=1 Tax=Nocardiopsis tropica TaxID=109330 RepID=A0ABU7KYZ4_9ACTN|nr:serine hydrolase domain-containing protein [Nocardiopsis umidischolae]MEE2054523.1 serine hydrolase domain-containing protein [Nocardiopsis umidischolae]